MPKAWPYGDMRLDSPLIYDGTNTLSVFSAIQGVMETGERRMPLYPGTGFFGYHVACTGDTFTAQGRNAGRWFMLFTPNEGRNATVGITKGAFHSSERRLLGGYDVSAGDAAPDLVNMHNTVYATDGHGRWLAGSVPATYVFSDDGGSFKDESADAATNTADDVDLLPSGAAAVNDALYIGAGVTFSGFWIDQTTAMASYGASGLTLVLEYWDGSAWSTVSHKAGLQADFPFLFGGGSAALGAFQTAQQHRVHWDHATDMSDWATTSVNSQTAYWVRLRVSAGASGGSYTNPKARKVFLIEDSTSTNPLLPACYVVGNNPGTTAPFVRAWGLHRLDVNGTSQVSASLTATGGGLLGGNWNIYYTWYDSVRDIETEPVLLGNVSNTVAAQKVSVTLGNHPDPNVDKIRIYFEGTGGAMATEAAYVGDSAGIGAGLLRLVSTQPLSGGDFAVAGIGAWTAIDRTRMGDGPYLASSIAADNVQPDVAAANGFYRTCAVHKSRVYCAGTEVEGYQFRVVWSNPNVPDTFPAVNHVDLPMSNGDRILAIRSAGDVAVVIGLRSVWALVSDPGSGNHSVRQIANIGGIAQKACVEAGQRVFFLGAAGIYAVGGGGTVELVTQRLRRLFRDILESTPSGISYHLAGDRAVGAYDATREVVYFAMPGLLDQLSGAAGTVDAAVNDGYLALDLLTGRVSFLVGPPAASMGSVPTGNAGSEMWTGTYLGRLLRMTNDVLDTNATAAISGTATGTHSSTTLQDTGLSLTASTSDKSFVGQTLVKSNAAKTVMEARAIKTNTTDTFTLAAAWTNAPINGDLYYIGHIFGSVESGDWLSEDPEATHRVNSTSLHLESAMDSGNELTVGVARLPRGDTSTAFAYGGDLSTARALERVSAGGETAPSQRLRLLFRLGATRFRLFALSVKRVVFGRQGG